MNNVSAPESLIETLRSRLVYPRRHVAAARDRLAGRFGPPDLPAVEVALVQATRSISELERIIERAAAETICTCTCGHVHYKHGGDA